MKVGVNYDRDGPVVRRLGVTLAGSYLGHRKMTFAFTTPPGFVHALRLAHMLGSLVHVTRRVGQVTDPSATDTESAARHPLSERSRLEGTGDSPPSSNDRPRTRPETDRDWSSSVRQRANADRAYNTATEVVVTLPGRF